MLNVAIVGLGRWGQRLVDAICAPQSAKLRFTHAVTRTPDKVRAYCSARSLVLGDDLAQVLADSGVGAVVLATPHSQHAAQVAAAAAAGKHVFVEKPFTLDAASARAAGNFSGSFGLRYSPGAWRATQAESPAGGMTAMGIHIIDAFIGLAGPIAALRCDSQRRALQVDLDDTTTVFARFASGATGCMSTLTATGRIFRLQVFGTRGWLHLLDHHILEICDLEDRLRRIEYPQVNIERAELEAFADAIAGAAPYPVPVADAIHGVAVMQAAIESARMDGERVAVDTRAI